MRRSRAKSQLYWRSALGAAACGLAVAGCAREGQAPASITIDEDSVAVHQLIDITDPYGDVFIAPSRGLFIDFGRAEPIIECERRGYICTEWPFVFSFPEDGAPPSAPWTIGDYEFEVIAQAERDFCGRTREAYLVQGANETGWSTRVWYHPGFGVYAVMSGQAYDGVLTQIERAFITCDRGLFARRGGLLGRGSADE
mgnify:CR=1 FL=1